MKRKIPKDIEPILKEVKKTLKNIYGANLKKIILYGSYARGDADEGSDIDIIILIKNMKDPVTALEKCSKNIHQIDYFYDTLISIVPIDAEEYNVRKLPVILNAKREGIPI